jgi:hypothetical protein
VQDEKEDLLKQQQQQQQQQEQQQLLLQQTLLNLQRVQDEKEDLLKQQQQQPDRNTAAVTTAAESREIDSQECQQQQQSCRIHAANSVSSGMFVCVSLANGSIMVQRLPNVAFVPDDVSNYCQVVHHVSFCERMCGQNVTLEW